MEIQSILKNLRKKNNLTQERRFASPLTAPPIFAGRQSRGDSKECCTPHYYQRGGISMTGDEACNDVFS